MMLVMVSLAMATILATSYLVSRDNSVAISRNSTASMQARWAALSALETTAALFQTDTDWRLNHVNGILLDGFELAGARVTVTALDIEKNTAPDADTEYLRVLAVAEVDIDNDGTPDAHQSTVFLVYVPVASEPRVSVGLDEFAVFTRDRLTMRNSSTLTRWATAPLDNLGGRINIGTHSQNSGSISMLDNSACIDCTVYHPDGASATLVNDASGPAVSSNGLPFNIRLPYSPGPDEPNQFGGMPTLNLDGSVTTITGSDRFHNVNISNGSVWTLQGDLTIAVENKLTLTTGAKMIVDGDVQLVVFDDATLTDASIELTPGSTLVFYCADDIFVTDGYIGEERTDDVRDNTGNEQYMDPLDIRIFEFEAGMASSRDWDLKGNSIVKGTVHTEDVDFRIMNESALYGRFAGNRLTLSETAGFFYDTSLDEQVGYTNPQSGLYDGSGDLVAAFLTNFDLTSVSLQSLADITGKTILANGMAIASATAPPPPDPPGPGDPTPRPVLIQTTLVSFGPDMSQWEHPNSIESGNGGGAGGGGMSLFGPGGIGAP
jgi:hypothetical protein